MEITKLIREIKSRKMTAEELTKFARCCNKLMSEATKEDKYLLDYLLKEAQKHYPKINIEGLMARKGIDEEILAYIIIATMFILRDNDAKKRIGALFDACSCQDPLLQEMSADLDEMAANRVKKDK